MAIGKEGNIVLSKVEELFQSKKAQGVNMNFIARYPSAILILAGVLMILIGKTNWAIVLIGLGAALHILWLRR